MITAKSGAPNPPPAVRALAHHPVRGHAGAVDSRWVRLSGATVSSDRFPGSRIRQRRRFQESIKPAASDHQPAALHPAATVEPSDMMMSARASGTLRQEATHSRIRVADRSRGCTQTAIGRHVDTRRQANGLPITRSSTATRPHFARTSYAPRPHTDCRRTALEALSNRRSLRRTSTAMHLHAGAAAESSQGRSRTARRMGMTTWPRRSRLWPSSFLSNEWNFRARAAVGSVD